MRDETGRESSSGADVEFEDGLTEDEEWEEEFGNLLRLW